MDCHRNSYKYVVYLDTKTRFRLTFDSANMMGLRFGEASEVPNSEEDSPIAQALKRKLLQGRDGLLASDDTATADEGTESTQDELADLELQYPGDAELDGSGSNDIDSEQSSNLNRHVRRWTATDRADLNKLANMISYFLEVPQFAAEPKVFQTHVIAPLMESSGPKHGSVDVLMQVMKSVMIRHRYVSTSRTRVSTDHLSHIRIEDVERDITLPPLRHETVLLDMDTYGTITYNVMQAQVVINAVDSERVDQDYFFHPRVRRKLHDASPTLTM